MKFKKFVKSLGADGILYVRENGDRWLSSGSIFMKVPEDIRTVTACDSASMLSLSLIENIINYDTFICNDGYALIERGDIVEMFVDEKISALVIKRPVDLVDEEIVGVILRTEY